jgi:hypothetical protein
VPGAAVGHNAVVALGVAAFGVAEFIVYPELWGRGGHMGSFLQIPTQSAQALFALWMIAGMKIPGNNNLDTDKKEQKQSSQRCDNQ